MNRGGGVFYQKTPIAGTIGHKVSAKVGGTLSVSGVRGRKEGSFSLSLCLSLLCLLIFLSLKRVFLGQHTLTVRHSIPTAALLHLLGHPLSLSLSHTYTLHVPLSLLLSCRRCSLRSLLHRSCRRRHLYTHSNAQVTPWQQQQSHAKAC